MRSNFAEAQGRSFNWAAGLAWIVTVAVCTTLVRAGHTQIYFVSLPGWFVTVILYIGLSWIMQRNTRTQGVA
jgi:phage shock protein PspC (stress-responsive transcriptional regulator)